MKILVAPDSFKGSCSSIEAAEYIEQGILAANNKAEVIKIPIGDGGEGTVEAITYAASVEIVSVIVEGPTGEPTQAQYALLGDTAILEMASASGITIPTDKVKDPYFTSTYGTGQLIANALDKRVKRIIICLGGSATNDGGAGALQALGFFLSDNDGNELEKGGKALSRLAKINADNSNKRLSEVEIILACDVTNPLLGELGATKVYGPQKGVVEEKIEILEKALTNFANISGAFLKKDYRNHSGAGAAGGLGFGLMSFCGAKFASGIDTVLDLCGFDDFLAEADLVITGEGKIDGQSAFGKVLFGIGKRAQLAGVPVIALGGAITEDARNLYEVGITAMFSITNRPMTLENSMENTGDLIKYATENAVRLFLKG